MIATAVQTGQLIVYVGDEPIDDDLVATIKDSHPSASLCASADCVHFLKST